MTLRQTILAAPGKTAELIEKLAGTSNQAVKTRENIFTQLSEELARYVAIEEEHFLPLLRKHQGTKALAADALKGNKDLQASLKRLSEMPKDNDDFLGMRRLCPIDVPLAVARSVALAIGSCGCQNSYEVTGESRMRSFSWN
jgi:hypothetical protein